jgi:hypothetical protein
MYNDNFLTQLPDLNISSKFIAGFKLTPANALAVGRLGTKQIGKIEIVLPDITKGKDWNSTNKTKFYKYVVYNHTSCKCGTLKFRDSTLYQTITNNEGKSNEHACFVITFLSIFRNCFPVVL